MNEYSKYEYSTASKQKFLYRFKPNASRRFVTDLDFEVVVRTVNTPGKYTIVIDKPVRECEDGSLEVCLQIKRNNELSAEHFKVEGWCYADE